MTPQYEWDDNIFPKGVNVFVGREKRPGVVHSRSMTANGTFVYGVRFKVNDGDSAQRARRRGYDDVDCYCEAHDMESLLF